jgi:DNA polymerase III subunit epsilon
LFAIVDIETTGGYAANNAITEVAIVLHDGKQEIKRYETLVNPEMNIPRYVQALTGINDEMVRDAPHFADLAENIFGILNSAVFVAHNVNFDYSFLKHHLRNSGFELNSKKLCTVRLSRKVFPGFLSYSLGNLCRSLGIEISNRHRAGGDVDATVKLFEKILLHDQKSYVAEMMKGKNKEQYLPPNLSADQFEQLPYTTGVYYFHNEKGKVVYVGKAKNLRKRVGSHFSNNKPNKQKQEFLRNIYSISYQTCGTELMAFLTECVEIKRLWPQYNRSLKRFEQTYGLYMFEDMNGYQRLAIEKIKKTLEPLYTFSLLHEGQNILRKLIREFNLCPKLCFLQVDDGKCEGRKEKYCYGACEQVESVNDYNTRVGNAVGSLKGRLPSFTIIGKGRTADEQSCILIERGRFYGMGYLPADAAAGVEIEELKNYLTPYPENDYMRGLVYQHASGWSYKKIDISVA